MNIPRIHPSTRKALANLLGHALERLLTTGNPGSLRTMSDDAQRLRVESPDGRAYTGVLVVHDNVVTTGAVAPQRVEPHVLAASAAASLTDLAKREDLACRT